MLGFVRAEQPVVDEHTCELIPNGLVHEDGSDRRIDAAGQAADDLLAADLLADFLDRFFDDRDSCPRRSRVGRLVQEVLEEVDPPRGVGYLGMELHSV